MIKKKGIQFLLTGILFFVMTGHLFAQTDSVAAIIGRIRSIQTATPFDTASFVKSVDAITTVRLIEKDITALHELASGFDKGADLDMDLYIRGAIMESISRSDFSRAIDYGKQLLLACENNKGPNREILRTTILKDLRTPYRSSNRLREGFLFYNDLLAKSIVIGDKQTAITCHFVLVGFYRTIGLYDVAIYHMKKALALTDTTEKPKPSFLTLSSGSWGMYTWTAFTGLLSDCYLLKGDFENAILYSSQALAATLRYKSAAPLAINQLMRLTSAYAELNKPDSAEYYLNMAIKRNVLTDDDIPRHGIFMQVWSLFYLKKGKPEMAEPILMDCLKLIREKKLITITPSGVVAPDYYLSLVKIAQGQFKDAISFLKLDLERVNGLRDNMLRDYKLLAETYDKIGDQQKAKESYARYVSLQDSLLADQSRYRMLNFEAEEQMVAKEKSISQLQTDNKINRILWWFSLGIVLLVIILASLIYQRYRIKRKANSALEKTLTELKSTQSQLIQSEKMASLGELTAGIAHEIQNPLNFVNNFSELNAELVDELQHELKTGNTEEALAISNDIKDNEQKINHHGKRADAIVKGMLQHSSSGSGKKEPTDINKLADEYLRLAYHGLRAKDKSFNAAMVTDFDASIGMVNIIPQDMGRVILNLITNAFYAVNAPQPPKGGVSYEPTVWVSTKKMGDKVFISVKDNGSGIPTPILDKIFQPFFTTKPTGQGTGLGLSLSYDIVKAHGGELTVETKQEKGSIFVIQIPAK
ncbi:MAG: ATP-binding protein [Bacteroidota bacterium]